MMVDPGPDSSVTGWFHAVKSGDQRAAAQLWDRYFDRIVRVARQKLVHDPAYDEEDLAASVLRSMYAAASETRYSEIGSRDELWALLLVLAQRKLIDRFRRSTAQKRVRPGQASADADIHDLPGREPVPDVSASVREECGRLLDLLGDPSLQDIALRRLDGCTVAEIAAELGFGERTVHRRIALVRKKWQEYLPEESEGATGVVL